MAIALVRHKFRGRRAANLLIVIPMATPEIVIGASLLSMFIYYTVALGFTTLLIAHVMFSISFVVVVVRSRLIGFDRHLEEAAADLGATPLATFRNVTLPLLAPGILAAALLAFALSIDDFVISNFNSGTTVTFPLYVYGVEPARHPGPGQRAGDDALPRHRDRRRARHRPAAPRRADGRGPARPRGRCPAPPAAAADMSAAAAATTSAASGVRPTGSRRSTTSTRLSGEVAARVPLSGAAEVRAAVEAARAAQPGWREVPPQRRARAVLALREELLRAARGAGRAGQRRHGQDARGRRRRGRPRDRVGRVGGGDPPPAQGRDARGRRRRGRRRAGPPAGRRRRRDHALQLPGDDPALVPALRDRLRQQLPAQALRAGPAPGGADRRVVDAVEEIPPGVVNLVHGGRDGGQRRSSRTPASTRSPSSAGRRRPGSSPKAPPAPASGCRHSAAPRTRWS